MRRTSKWVLYVALLASMVAGIYHLVYHDDQYALRPTSLSNDRSNSWKQGDGGVPVLSGPAQPQPLSRAVKSISRLRLRVVGDDAPLLGASVVSDRAPSTVLRTTASGEVDVPFDARGVGEQIVVRAWAPGFADGIRTYSGADVGLDGSPDTEHNTIVLKPLIAVRGHLAWDDGQVVPGITVSAWYMSPEAAQRFERSQDDELTSLRGEWDATSKAITAADGAFELHLAPHTAYELVFAVPGDIVGVTAPLSQGIATNVVLLWPQGASTDLGIVSVRGIRLGIAASRDSQEWRIANWAMRILPESAPLRVSIRSDLRAMCDVEAGKVVVLQAQKPGGAEVIHVQMELGNIRVPVSVKLVDSKVLSRSDYTWFGYDRAGCQPVRIVANAVQPGSSIGCIIERVTAPTLRLESVGTTPGGVIWLWPGEYTIAPLDPQAREVPVDVSFISQRFVVGTDPVTVVLDGVHQLSRIRILPVDELGRALRRWRLRREGSTAPDGYSTLTSDGWVRLTTADSLWVEAPGRVPASVPPELWSANLRDGATVVVPMMRSTK